MKKNLLILVAIILIVIPLKVNSFSEAYLEETCKPLIWLNPDHTQYQCKELATPSNPFGVFDLTVNVNLTGLDAPNAQSDEKNLDSYKDSNTCSNTGECFRGVGLMFQLIYYNGEGEPVTVGNKYHVYNPALLTDQTIADKVALPQTPYDFRDPNQDFHLEQQLSPGTEDGKVHNLPAEEGWYEVQEPHIIHQDGKGYYDDNEVWHEAQPPNKYLGTSDYDTEGTGSTHDGKDMYSYQQDFSEQTKYYAHDNIVHIYSDWTYGKTSGWIIYILKYMSNYSKTTYPKTKILSPGWSEGQPLKALDFSGWEEDSTLTEEEVGSNYLKNKVSKYFARETVAETVKAVNSKFGTNISERDLQYYYIEVQAIYRVYTDKKEKVGSFLVKQIPEVVQDPVKVDRSFFVESSSTTANDPYLCRYHKKTWLERAACREEENTCKKKAGADKDLTCSFDKNGSCTASDGSDSCFWMRFDAEPVYGGCGTCDGNKYVKEEVPYFYFLGAPNGKKVLHKVLGTAYEGWSQLVYTKSSVDETCDTNKITTSLGDVMSQNKHCELDEFSSEYSEQEKANQCASQNKYHYYIGPDEKRGLVGTKSTNPYNLFGSDGNKCRSGVKHYYLLDLEATGNNKPPKCQQMCDSAGAHDSNSYLQCAETYCDYDVDYSLGGQPFVRKRDCLLNKLSCDYQYGREPTMGSSSGKERQSVSSCANTKLFKTGSGTNYTLEKTPVNSSSSCGTLGASDLSELTGKDSICIGDVVTDYNGTDAGDTSFDTRTYINIACQEEESITSVGGMNEPVRAGLPISYSIKTKGKVTCVAFFNYEQWKVDYAVVPSQDIIRRKRLDYIYQKYNNLMTNGYTVDSSLTSFDAYDLDGKTMQHWTITDADGLGQIKWDEYVININNSKARAESKETLKNDTTKKQEENPLTDFTKDIATLSVVPSEMDLTNGVYKAYNTGNNASGGVISSDKKLIKVAHNSITTPGTGSNGNSMLVGYVQTSTDTKSYVYAKYCVNREGKVDKADATGICSDGKTGNNAFYTDLGDVPTLDNNTDIHNIKGTVDVTTSLPTSDLNIYKDEDICPINILSTPPPPGGKKAYCKFKIISGDSIGDKTFLNGSGVEVMIEFYDDMGIKINPDSFSISINSPYRADVSTSKYNILKLKSSALASGLEEIYLKGNFSYQGKETKQCSENLTIIQKGNMCDIDKKEDKVYTVNTNVSNPAVVMGGMLNQRITQDYNGNHYPTNLGRLGRPKSEGGLYKYLLDLKKSSFDNQSVVVGYVNNGTKGEFCYRPEGTIKQCVKNTETGNGLYLPGQYEEITNYCGTNWAKDTYGFDSYADCVDTCARCPTHENEVIGWEDNAQATQDNIKKVNDFCDAYATYGYSSKDVCVSLVYERCINPGDYKYRPVNTSNPFPSAVDNATIAPGYNVGDRIIGSNWKGKEHYITEGNPSVPRYQIALTADRIKRIKGEISKDTKAGIYTQLNPVNNSVESKSYMSKYVRDTTYFYDMFCFIQGERTNNTTGGCEINQ